MITLEFLVLYINSCSCTDRDRRLKSNGQLDFSNPESVEQLTKSLLKRDFGLKIELSPDRLCPPVSLPIIVRSLRVDWYLGSEPPKLFAVDPESFGFD